MKQLLYIFLFVGSLSSFSQNLINHRGQDLFFAGINIAWMQFGNDLTQFNPSHFSAIMKDVSEAGGNSVRWWIHVDGRSTPTFTNDTVTGITEQALDNLELALDIAADYGIVVSLCLWSFDMMNTSIPAARRNHNRILLENERALQAYIDNALIPMVERVGGHTAILCWEIFNEPEGMTNVANWNTTENVTMAQIQRFVNRTAGAIKRTDPTAKVSNGSWNARMSTDISSFSGAKNYYTDAELIAAGGDSDGILDFYMFHYYPEWHNDRYSPFHNHASHWELDKPVLIGEYSAHGIIRTGSRFSASSELNATEALTYLFDNGYAGGWGWTYTAHDGHGSLDDMRHVLDSLRAHFPELLIVARNPNHNYSPVNVKELRDTFLFKNSDPILNYLNLDDYFEDDGVLQYSIEPHGPVQISFENNSVISLSVIPDSMGVSTFLVVATDEGGKQVSSRFTIMVRDSVVQSDNKLLYSFVTGSSVENEERLLVYTVDGDFSTRWSSAYSHTEWIQFDMLNTYSISRLVLYWEAAFGNRYAILVSEDAQNWDTVISVGRGKSGVNNYVFPQVQARYVKIDFTQRATSWGYSLFQVEAFADNAAQDNVAPIAFGTYMGRTLMAGQTITETIQMQRFYDANDDVLQFSVAMASGQDVPDWIVFDAYTHRIVISPKIEHVGQYILRITGTDWFGESAYHDVTITVNNPNTHISEYSNTRMSVYPNPVFGASSVHIVLPQVYEGYVNVKLVSVSGLSVFETPVYVKQDQLDVELPSIPAGVYAFVVQAGNSQYVSMILIQ